MTSFLAKYVTANGGRLTDDFYAKQQAQREFNVLTRCLDTMQYRCPIVGCGHKMTLKRNMKETKEIKNPEFGKAVPFGTLPPAEKITVPSEKYGRYFFMCLDPEKCHPVATNWKGEPTTRTDRNGELERELAYVPLSKFIADVPLDQFHPGIAALFKDQAPAKGPYPIASMTEEQLVELETNAAPWINLPGPPQ